MVYIYISHPLSIVLSTFIIQQVIRFTKIHFVFNLNNVPLFTVLPILPTLTSLSRRGSIVDTWYAMDSLDSIRQH